MHGSDLVPARGRSLRTGDATSEPSVVPHQDVGARDITDYLRMVWQWRYAAAAVFALVMAGAVVYAFTATPIYQARAQLLIEPESPNVLEFKQVVEEQTGKVDYYATQLQILRSRTLARATLDRLKLWQHPEFKAQEDLFSRVGSRVRAQSEPTTANTGENAAGESIGELQAIGRFLQRLSVEPIRTTRLVNIYFSSADPKLSADVVNTLVNAYIERSMDLKLTTSAEALTWLNEQLSQHRADVDKEEHFLQQFRDRNDSVTLEGRQNIVAQRLGDLNAAGTRAKTERIAKETAFEQLQRFDDSVDVTQIPDGVLRPAVDELRMELVRLQHEEAHLAAQLGDRHPDLVTARLAVKDMDRRVRDEIARQRDTAQAEVAAARTREQRLSEAFEAQKAEVLGLDRKAIEYGALQREASSNRQMLESLLQRANEMSVSRNLKTSNIRIVDEASTPLSSVFPRRRVILGVAAFVGITFGLGTALLLGYADTRLRSPEEVRRQLDMPVLGSVPSLPRRVFQNAQPLLARGVSDEFAEALRIVRTNVALDRDSSGPQILLVTSTASGEGKTLIATNLAVALAHARQRVLLIDGDMRRPCLHEAFDLPQAPGLSELFRDSTIAATAVRDSSVPGLKILTAGTEPLNPADILGFDPIARISDMLGRDFDWIVIDSPPVGDVTDACLFAGGATRVLFVVAGDRVTRADARAAVDRLVAADASFAGAVLSRVSPRRHGYSYARH